MGEWGKWWSGRGKDLTVKCTFCGRTVPKHKAVQVNIGGRLSRDIYEVAEVVSMAGSKGYACISCAKHRHLVKDGIHTTEKDKRIRERTRAKKEMDKVLLKVKEMEKKEQRPTKRPDAPESKPSQPAAEAKPAPKKAEPKD